MATPILSVSAPVSAEPVSIHSVVANSFANDSHNAFKSELNRAADQSKKNQSSSQSNDKASSEGGKASSHVAKNAEDIKIQSKSNKNIAAEKTSTPTVSTSVNDSDSSVEQSVTTQPQQTNQTPSQEVENGQMLPFSGEALPQQVVLDIAVEHVDSKDLAAMPVTQVQAPAAPITEFVTQLAGEQVLPLAEVMQSETVSKEGRGTPSNSALKEVAVLSPQVTATTAQTIPPVVANGDSVANSALKEVAGSSPQVTATTAQTIPPVVANGDSVANSVLNNTPEIAAIVSDKLSDRSVTQTTPVPVEKTPVVTTGNNPPEIAAINAGATQKINDSAAKALVNDNVTVEVVKASAVVTNENVQSSATVEANSLVAGAAKTGQLTASPDQQVVGASESLLKTDKVTIDPAERIQTTELADNSVKETVQKSVTIGPITKQASISQQEINPKQNDVVVSGKTEQSLVGDKAVVEGGVRTTSNTVLQAVQNSATATLVPATGQSEQSASLNQYLEKMRAGVDPLTAEKNSEDLANSKIAATKLPDSLIQLSNLQNSLRTNSPVQMQMPVGTPPTAANWSSSIADKVFIAASQNLRVVNIQLDPPELGALQVRLQISGPDQQLSATFSSPNGAVRDVLEQQLPRLREMLAEQGINLGEASVSDQGADNSRRSDVDERNSSGDYADSEEGAAEFNPLNSQGTLSLVDFYA